MYTVTVCTSTNSRVIVILVGSTCIYMAHPESTHTVSQYIVQWHSIVIEYVKTCMLQRLIDSPRALTSIHHCYTKKMISCIFGPWLRIQLSLYIYQTFPVGGLASLEFVALVCVSSYIQYIHVCPFIPIPVFLPHPPSRIQNRTWLRLNPN